MPPIRLLHSASAHRLRPSAAAVVPATAASSSPAISRGSSSNVPYGMTSTANGLHVPPPANGDLPEPPIPPPPPPQQGFFSKLFRRGNRVADATTYAQTPAVDQAPTTSQEGNKDGNSPPTQQPSTEEAPKGWFKRKLSKLKNYVFDPSTDTYYRWTVLVSVAYVYNLTVVIARQVFADLIGPTGPYNCYISKTDPWADNKTRICDEEPKLRENMKRMPFMSYDSDFGWGEYYWLRIMWLLMDLAMDSIYWADIWVRRHTGYLEQGLLVKDVEKITKKYKSTRQYKLDLLSIVPLDYILGWPLPIIPYLPIVRLNRLLRVNRITDCMERTETRSSIPNAFRVLCVVVYIIVIIHWNACFYFWISEVIGLGTDGWVYGPLNHQSLPEDVADTLLRRYIYSFYWSTLILTTIGEVPGPVQNIEFLFVTLDLMGGVLIFATIVGNVGSMISNMSAARTEFQNKMDGIKQYMELRKVSKQLEARVIKWFDYLWANKQSLSDQQVLKVLPDKLQAEIAMQVHFETLRKVRIFQDCEAGLLTEMVLKLQLQVFSPGDYICRKGDIGREMYIVKRGKLQVCGEDDGHGNIPIFVTLQEGSVFGELSILNIAGSKNGNRRSANVRSVGYTDLFVLNKNDLWTVLREYPEAKKMLLQKGRDMLKKDGLIDENAPEEQKTAEELAEMLNGQVQALQTRMARLIAEHTSTEMKLTQRIELLEGKLNKYRALVRRQKSLHTSSIDMNPHNG